jgi:small-conductance mechanosensitive channel
VVAKVTPDFRLALGSGAAAVACLVGYASLGSIGRHAALHDRLVGYGTAGGFLVFSLVSVRSVASEMNRVLTPRTGPSHAAVVRWVITIAGVAIILLTGLGLLDVPIGHLLLGGALTGVIVGIAAQQALGNVFAGVVLLLARPFNVGDQVWMRAGALGGDLFGTITGMGLTYVTLLTDDGPLSIPNSGALGAVIGPRPVVTPAAEAAQAHDQAAYDQAGHDGAVAEAGAGSPAYPDEPARAEVEAAGSTAQPGSRG